MPLSTSNRFTKPQLEQPNKPQLEQPNMREGDKADSRSTSAGSRASGNRHGATSNVDYSTSKQLIDLPDYEYPVPVIVRNTFIDTKDARPDSLEAFFEERRIHSSPAVPKDRQFSADGITFGGQGVMSSVTGLWKGYLEDDCPATPTSDLRFDSWSDDECYGYGDSMPEALPEGLPRVLMLSEALPEAMPEGSLVLGSPEMPTMGSAGHHLGQCKPCAFFHTRVCENGVNCTFCHLCAPDEKRRRQKEKHAAYREMRRQRQQRRQAEQSRQSGGQPRQGEHRRQNTIVAI